MRGLHTYSHLYDQLIQITSSTTSSDITSKPVSSGSAESAVIHHWERHPFRYRNCLGCLVSFFHEFYIVNICIQIVICTQIVKTVWKCKFLSWNSFIMNIYASIPFHLYVLILRVDISIHILTSGQMSKLSGQFLSWILYCDCEHLYTYTYVTLYSFALN